MSTELQLIPGTLATNCYPADPQVLYNEIMEKGAALIGDIKGVIISASQPDPEDRDKAWIKLTAAGGPPSFYLPYVWYNGQWVARNPSAASGNERRLWVGTTGELATYDGGEAGTVGDASGPMWEVDSEFAGRFAVGVGTVPDTSVAVAVATNVGAGQVTLTEDNLPPHTHEIGIEESPLTGDAEDGYIRTDDGTSRWSTGDSSEIGMTRSTGGTGTPAAAAPFDIVPPARGVYFIRRTARIYYRA